MTGCDHENPPPPDVLVLDEHASGDNQCGMYGEALAKPLQAAVLGRQVRGWLGGKGARKPVEGIEVVFTVENPATGAVFEENGDNRLAVITNAAGVAAARLKLGHTPGDVYVTASADSVPNPKPVRFRALAGVEIIGRELEGPTGGVIDAFGLRLHDAPGTPAEGVEVQFRVVGDDHGAKVGNDVLFTDRDGLAVTTWKLGQDVDRYFARAAIRDTRPIPESERFHAAEVGFEAMGMNKGEMAVKLLGGLAVFIFGMKLMSGGLRRMADRRLKSILQAMTRNRLLAVVVGAGLTAMIQSSSATTVMTVGFVNAGLMTLRQAIGVELGATIGTTITAQIIAFRLEDLAFPAIAIGLILTGLSRKAHVKAAGEAILGFGLLFLGMQTMSGILKPLRHSPEFVALFRSFDCTPADGGMIRPGPALMCILIGTVATAVVQSSSATVGLVLALSSQGLVSFYTAVPLILGDNIGTTITAVLASAPANRNAKRTALAHTLFKVFGATYMYALLFVPLWEGRPIFLGFVDAITPGAVFSENPVNVLRHVANAHTAFNVLNCILLLPFLGAMVRLCQRIIPVTDADRETVLEYLEPHLLNTPTLALQQAIREVGYMVRRAQKSIDEACAFFHGGPRELEDRVLNREELIDRLQHEITAYLVDLSRRELAPAEAALIPALIHAVNDTERIGDHSETLVDLTRMKRSDNHQLTEGANREIRELQALLDMQFDAVLRVFHAGELDQAKTVLKKEDEINRLVRDATEAHVRRLEQGECEIHSGVIFLEVLTALERVGDRLTNIAERAGAIIQTVQ